MIATNSTVPRRCFIGNSLAVLAGMTLPAGAVTATSSVPAWLKALEQQAAWLKQEADGSWHCGTGNLAALTGALMQSLGPKCRVRASATGLTFTDGGSTHRVVLHHIA